MTEQTASSLPLLEEEAQIVDYLRSHPDFFLRHEDVLQDLRLPHPSGRAISLVERQLHLFREQRDTLQKELVDLIGIARHNDRLFEKSKRLLMQLLEADGLSELSMVLDDSIRNDFGLDAVSLLLLDPVAEVPGGVIHRVALEQAQALLGDLLEAPRAVCGALRAEQMQFLFPQQSRRILSVALIPLRGPGLLGVFAIGSVTHQYFDSSMGSLFLSYISDTLSRLLPPLLVRRLEAPVYAIEPSAR